MKQKTIVEVIQESRKAGEIMCYPFRIEKAIIKALKSGELNAELAKMGYRKVKEVKIGKVLNMIKVGDTILLPDEG
jgi:hypothetical protein